MEEHKIIRINRKLLQQFMLKTCYENNRNLIALYILNFLWRNFDKHPVNDLDT